VPSAFLGGKFDCFFAKVQLVTDLQRISKQAENRSPLSSFALNRSEQRKRRIFSLFSLFTPVQKASFFSNFCCANA
jgi:hypothetical protein